MKKLLMRAWRVYRERGIGYVLHAVHRDLVHWSKVDLPYNYYRIFKSRRLFVFQGRTYHYFYHRYNLTWTNERSVEVPIVLRIVNDHSGKEILEIGNVLSHYFPVKHDIVDKYEKAERVIQEDVVDFKPAKSYDLIISISTLEHVGWDEDPNMPARILGEPSKILTALTVLKSSLAKKGLMVVTLPLGQNRELDRLLREDKVQFSRRQCMRRISKDNRWVEVDWTECVSAKYGSPYPAANALIILFIENK